MLSFIISIIVVVTYIIYSWKSKKFYFFSPWFLPFAMFLLNYGFPVILLQHDNVIYEKAILLQNIGITCFLFGVIFSFYNSRSKRKVIIDCYFSEEHPITIKLILIIGICLLFIYGITSGVVINLMQGNNIEDLRRKSEIGFGILHEPAVFFTIFSICWLLCRNMVQKNNFSLLNAMVLIFIIILIYISTGHKASSLWLIFFIVGVYNKFKRVSLFRIMILILLLLVFVPLLNSIRRGQGLDISSFEERMKEQVTAPYEMHHRLIIDFVSTGKLPLQYGKQYYQDALYIIPRFLWKDKPLSFDYTIKQKIIRFTFPGGGIPAGNIASLYLNFSLIGVIIGMFTIGYFYQVLFTYYRDEKNITKIVILLMIIPKILNPSSVLSSLEVIVIFSLAVISFDRFLKKISRYFPFLPLK